MSEEEDEKKEPADREDAQGESGEEEEKESEEGEKKKGFRLRQLSGPQSCLAIVGCGTLAALAVVGAVVGILSAIFSGDSSSPDEEILYATPEARSSLDSGVLDLCERTIGSLSTINRPARTDEVADPQDYIDESGRYPDGTRIITDECSWDFISSSSGGWEMEFSYTAIIPTEENPESVALAVDEFEALKRDLDQNFDAVVSEGEERLADESYYIYGTSIDNPQNSSYTLLARSKSGVYVIYFEEDGSSLDDDIPREYFFAEANAIVDGVDIDLQRWVPD